MMTPRYRTLLIGLALCVPALGSCASQKALKNYEDEIASLRAERTQLKKENRGLRSQLDDYEIQLLEASVPVVVTEVAQYPEFDQLGIDYGLRGGNMVISVPAEISFASGKDSLSSSGQNALRTVARTLQSDFPDGIYWIEGHTDSDPIRKSNFDSNRHLSVMRALSVLQFLVDECGLPDEGFVVAGHGQYLPMAANDTGSNKARNRRVEIVVHQP